jgi:hypothetical protein
LTLSQSRRVTGPGLELLACPQTRPPGFPGESEECRIARDQGKDTLLIYSFMFPRYSADIPAMQYK